MTTSGLDPNRMNKLSTDCKVQVLTCNVSPNRIHRIGMETPILKATNNPNMMRNLSNPVENLN